MPAHFDRPPLKRLAVATFLLAGAVLVSGCADRSSWSPAASPKANKVELAHLSHDVTFPSGAVDMNAAGGTALGDFLARNDVGYGDRIYVVGSARQANPVATRRAEGIARHLRRQGLASVVLPSAEWAGSDEPNAVRVLVHRFVVTAPNCPDWRKPAAGDPANTEGSNLGCATAVNFGLMVADPRDMIEGRPEGVADGEREAAAIRRYREGKVTPLNDRELRDEGAK